MKQGKNRTKSIRQNDERSDRSFLFYRKRQINLLKDQCSSTSAPFYQKTLLENDLPKPTQTEESQYFLHLTDFLQTQ